MTPKEKRINRGYLKLAYRIFMEDNDLFDLLVKRLGMHQLEEKARKLTSYREYYRRWPFDGSDKALPLDVMGDLRKDGPSLEEQVMMRQEADRFLASLTDKQGFVANKLGEGYKPREIAQLQGDKDSGKVRWHRHVLKGKLTPKKEENQ